MQQAQAPKDQQLTSSVKAPSAPALHENKPAQAKLDGLIAGCFVIQKLYGRQPENIEIINRTFHSVLAHHPSDKVIRAFEAWLERSQEFPTPADIVGLIKRNGRPPLKESDVIAIRKKDGEYRTPEEWAVLRQWESQQQEDWGGEPDERKARDLQAENIRLRQELLQLKDEYRRLSELLREAKQAVGTEAARSDAGAKVERTIQAMREVGAPEEDVEEFRRSTGTLSDQPPAFPPAP
jgi:hypothetical protein